VRRRLLVLVLAVLIPVALVLGVALGGHPRLLPGFVRDALVGDSDAQVYDDALDRISADFYRKVGKGDLLDVSLKATVESLKDPFSRYIDPASYSDFEDSTNGNFEGIGLNVAEHPRGLQVLTVFGKSPAKAAGLEAGDLIVAVNGTSLKGKTSDDSTTEIKGPAGTSVRLTLVSGKRRREVTVKRAKVVVPVSEQRMETRNDQKIGYVSLTQFTAGAHGYVRQNVRSLLKRGAQGIVLDLRQNGGGLLQEGVLVASVFISDGLIVSTRGRNRPTRRFNASGDAIDTDVPVVVLVDGRTASASEIVTGALQDLDRAKIVGVRTFGKGVFQEIEPLANGGALDITVGEYFTPKGRNLGPREGKRGLTPDVEARDNPKTKPDEALQKALEVVGDEL